MDVSLGTASRPQTGLFVIENDTRLSSTAVSNTKKRTTDSEAITPQRRITGRSASDLRSPRFSANLEAVRNHRAFWTSSSLMSPRTPRASLPRALEAEQASVIQSLRKRIGELEEENKRLRRTGAEREAELWDLKKKQHDLRLQFRFIQCGEAPLAEQSHRSEEIPSFVENKTSTDILTQLNLPKILYTDSSSSKGKTMKTSPKAIQNSTKMIESDTLKATDENIATDLKRVVETLQDSLLANNSNNTNVCEIIDDTSRPGRMVKDKHNDGRIFAIISSLESIILSKNFDDALDATISIIQNHIKADRSSIFKVVHDTNTIESLRISGFERGVALRMHVGEGIAGRVALLKQTVNIRDAYKQTGFDQSFDQRTTYETKSILCVPCLDSSGKCLAVLQALNKHKGKSFFSKVDEAFLTLVGNTVARLLVIEEKTKESLQRTSNAIRTMHAAKTLFAVEDASLLTRLICQQARSLVEAESCRFFLVDHLGEQMFVLGDDEETQALGIGLRFPICDGLTGKVVRSATPLIVNDVRSDAEYDPDIDSCGVQLARVKSFLAVPVLNAGNEVTAVVQVVNKMLKVETSVDNQEFNIGFTKVDKVLLADLAEFLLSSMDYVRKAELLRLMEAEVDGGVGSEFISDQKKQMPLRHAKTSYTVFLKELTSDGQEESDSSLQKSDGSPADVLTHDDDKVEKEQNTPKNEPDQEEEKIDHPQTAAKTGLGLKKFKTAALLSLFTRGVAKSSL